VASEYYLAEQVLIISIGGVRAPCNPNRSAGILMISRYALAQIAFYISAEAAHENDDD
jgi:hypothetical protein